MDDEELLDMQIDVSRMLAKLSDERQRDAVLIVLSGQRLTHAQRYHYRLAVKRLAMDVGAEWTCSSCGRPYPPDHFPHLLTCTRCTAKRRMHRAQ